MQKILDRFEFDKLAIACSGGVDSMCLAYLAAQETEITALIIDHGLRAEAADEASSAAAVLNGLNIENHIIKVTVSDEGNLQENARMARYGAMTDWCKENGFDALATAHHADDNAENFLLRLARGSGVDGLAGIAAEGDFDGLKIIRPLLKHTKKELQEILANAKIEWVEDASNATDKYSRNKIRHALEALEEKDLLTHRINEAAENMARVKSFLDAETAAAEIACMDYERNEIDVEKYAKLHEEIAFRLLVKITSKLSAQKKRVRFEKLKNLHKAILAGKKKTLAGLVFTKKHNKTLIELEK